jgi:non-ribosomal peptide synthetase component F
MSTVPATTGPATVGELLELRRTAPDEEFLITDSERLTFGTADSRSAELAGALLKAGVGKGTRVGVLFPNSAAWLVSWLAAARIGALTVPLSTFAPGAELARLLPPPGTRLRCAAPRTTPPTVTCTGPWRPPGCATRNWPAARWPPSPGATSSSAP